MFEPLMLAHALAPHVGLAALPRLLLHEIMWRTPLAPAIARLGAVRASRPNADAVLARGEKVLVYPGGDREAFRSFFDRDRICFGDRRGYVALAIAHGVPLVPVVTAGMHSGFVCLDDGHAIASRFPLARALRVGVLPLTLGFPFGLMPLVPLPYLPLASGVRIRVLAPITFARSGAEAARDEAYVEACHARVVHAMQQALDALSLARTEERRARVHGWVDRAFGWLERVTRSAPRALPAASAPATGELVTLPTRTSRPSLPRAA
jgi:1-acyl-sn-glycerol-3-phosphate acyltransferase